MPILRSITISSNSSNGGPFGSFVDNLETYYDSANASNPPSIPMVKVSVPSPDSEASPRPISTQPLSLIERKSHEIFSVILGFSTFVNYAISALFTGLSYNAVKDSISTEDKVVRVAAISFLSFLAIIKPVLAYGVYEEDRIWMHDKSRNTRGFLCFQLLITAAAIPASIALLKYVNKETPIVFAVTTCTLVVASFAKSYFRSYFS